MIKLVNNELNVAPDQCSSIVLSVLRADWWDHRPDKLATTISFMKAAIR
jgi:hypothetical protein